MRNSLLLIIILVVSISCTKQTNDPFSVAPYSPRTSVSVSLEEFPINGTTIRAIEVVNDSTVWFAGSNGKWGYTLDDGKNWNVQVFNQISPVPEFRSISVLDNGDVFLVSIANPAALFKSTDMGNTWKNVYEDLAANTFFNAVEFWDTNSGILLGDPIDSCFHLATTIDGGETWNKVDCMNIPKAFPNEYPFAASNTNIALSGNKAWFGTGGKDTSRVFYSNDNGKTWNVTGTNIIAGGSMTGIYSIDFYNTMEGIVGGGDWDDPSMNSSNFAVTSDGGENWVNVGDSVNDGYAACVKFIKETEGKELFYLKYRAAGGSSSMSYSNDNGNTWQLLATENKSYLSVQFSSKNSAWLSGKNKIAKLTVKD